MTLIVGKEETHFTWFHEVLSFHSSFFAGAIKYSWSTESKDKIVRMSEDSPDVVREYVRCHSPTIAKTDHILSVGLSVGSPTTKSAAMALVPTTPPLRLGVIGT